MLIGLIADTHGFLDPRVLPAFNGIEAILHAGDIGSEDVLAQLAAIAPLTAVAGNNDGPLAHLGLPVRADVSVSGVRIHLVHRIVDARPPECTDVVVYGHSHKALVAERDGALYVNPGAAGRSGFHREVTVALLDLDAGVRRAEIVLLGPRLTAAPRKVR